MTPFLATSSPALGDVLRGLRKRRGWTQAQLAERAGLLPKTVSALESGTGQVLVSTLMRCLSALETDLLPAPRDRPAAGEAQPDALPPPPQAPSPSQEPW